MNASSTSSAIPLFLGTVYGIAAIIADDRRENPAIAPLGGSRSFGGIGFPDFGILTRHRGEMGASSLDLVRRMGYG
jgi:hypothetical protein